MKSMIEIINGQIGAGDVNRMRINGATLKALPVAPRWTGKTP